MSDPDFITASRTDSPGGSGSLTVQEDVDGDQTAGPVAVADRVRAAQRGAWIKVNPDRGVRGRRQVHLTKLGHMKYHAMKTTAEPRRLNHD